MIPLKYNLNNIVIQYTEDFIKDLGNNTTPLNGDELLTKYKKDLLEVILSYKEELKKEYITLNACEDPQDDETLLRNIDIVYELIKVGQIIEERYNSKNDK